MRFSACVFSSASMAAMMASSSVAFLPRGAVPFRDAFRSSHLRLPEKEFRRARKDGWPHPVRSARRNAPAGARPATRTNPPECLTTGIDRHCQVRLIAIPSAQVFMQTVKTRPVLLKAPGGLGVEHKGFVILARRRLGKGVFFTRRRIEHTHTDKRRFPVIDNQVPQLFFENVASFVGDIAASQRPFRRASSNRWSAGRISSAV